MSQAKTRVKYPVCIGVTGGMGCGKSTVSKLLAEHGFTLIDSDALIRDKILHLPEVVAAVVKKYGDEIRAELRGRWVIEVPLLFEKQLENWFDFIVCVASSPKQQLARLEQRGIPRPLAEQRISKQLLLAKKIELSDFVLWNDGPISFLKDQVNILYSDLQSRL